MYILIKCFYVLLAGLCVSIAFGYEAYELLGTALIAVLLYIDLITNK